LLHDCVVARKKKEFCEKTQHEAKGKDRAQKQKKGSRWRVCLLLCRLLHVNGQLRNQALVFDPMLLARFAHGALSFKVLLFKCRVKHERVCGWVAPHRTLEEKASVPAIKEVQLRVEKLWVGAQVNPPIHVADVFQRGWPSV